MKSLFVFMTIALLMLEIISSSNVQTESIILNNDQSNKYVADSTLINKHKESVRSFHIKKGEKNSLVPPYVKFKPVEINFPSAEELHENNNYYFVADVPNDMNNYTSVTFNLYCSESCDSHVQINITTDPDCLFNNSIAHDWSFDNTSSVPSVAISSLSIPPFQFGKYYFVINSLSNNITASLFVQTFSSQDISYYYPKKIISQSIHLRNRRNIHEKRVELFVPFDVSFTLDKNGELMNNIMINTCMDMELEVYIEELDNKESIKKVVSKGYQYSTLKSFFNKVESTSFNCKLLDSIPYANVKLQRGFPFKKEVKYVIVGVLKQKDTSHREKRKPFVFYPIVRKLLITKTYKKDSTRKKNQSYLKSIFSYFQDRIE